MKRAVLSCCGTKISNDSLEGDREIPEDVRKELEERGGLESLAERIPSRNKLEEKSRVYHALSDPLRLTILYMLRDQSLCVCVINRFMHLAGSKLSYHLNILKESGLIEGEYQGKWIIYSLTEMGREYIR